MQLRYHHIDGALIEVTRRQFEVAVTHSGPFAKEEQLTQRVKCGEQSPSGGGVVVFCPENPRYGGPALHLMRQSMRSFSSTAAKVCQVKIRFSNHSVRSLGLY